MFEKCTKFYLIVNNGGKLATSFLSVSLQFSEDGVVARVQCSAYPSLTKRDSRETKVRVNVLRKE